jgi:hypothetical protein
MLSALATLWTYTDAGVGVGEDLADCDGGDAGGIEGPDEGVGVGSGDEKAAGGLGIVKDGAEVVRDSRVVFDEAFGEVAVVTQASRDVADADAI